MDRPKDNFPASVGVHANIIFRASHGNFRWQKRALGTGKQPCCGLVRAVDLLHSETSSFCFWFASILLIFSIPLILSILFIPTISSIPLIALQSLSIPLNPLTSNPLNPVNPRNFPTCSSVLSSSLMHSILSNFWSFIIGDMCNNLSNCLAIGIQFGVIRASQFGRQIQIMIRANPNPSIQEHM